MFKLKSIFQKRKNSLAPPLGEKKGFWHNNKYIILSFIIPFAIISLAFGFYNITPFGFMRNLVKWVVYGIGQLFPQLGITVTPDTVYPFGDKQILVVDAWHQYYPFLYDMHEKLQQGSSMFWTWSVGLGADFIALGSYYLFSPLNFLSVFVPDGALVSYLAVITAVKIACCGMFTAICFKIIFKKNDYSLVLFSVLFALCSYNMGYYWCVMWLDSVAMLPLVVAGTVCLLRDGKIKLFTISLALAVIFNYYIGFFICIAVFLTAIGYIVVNRRNLRAALGDIIKTAICSVTALLMTAFVTVPAFLGLQNCYKSSSGITAGFDINHGDNTVTGLLEAVLKIFSNALSFIAPTYLEGLPNIACGILCIVLLGVFFFSKKIKLSEKLFCSITLTFLAAGFIFRQLDYVMHAFHFPNMLPHRYSFISCFLLIYMAFRAFSVMEESKFYHILLGGGAFTVLAVLYILRPKENFSLIAICGSAAVALAIIAILSLSHFKIMPKRVMAVLLCLVVLGEVGVSSLIGVKTVENSSVKGYFKYNSDITTVLDNVNDSNENEFFRTEKAYMMTHNDGALYGYNGVSTFSSMLNVNTSKYATYLGAGGNAGSNIFSYYESSPVTNLILNLKYLIDIDDKIRNTDYLTEVSKSGDVTLYENTAYVPMGFMTDSDVINSYSVSPPGKKISYGNPFENQISWFRAATGIETPVYNKIPLENFEFSDETVEIKELEQDIYSLKVKTDKTDKGQELYTRYNYTVEEDCSVYVVFRATVEHEENISITVNGNKDDATFTTNGTVKSVGELKAGDKLSIRTDYKKEGSGKFRVCCYSLNKEVFDEGVEILRKNVLKTTTVTDTAIKGTVTADKDGLLYTSIPYQTGWRAKVDGKDADITVLGGSMCGIELAAGEHTVEIYYIPVNFLMGLGVSAIGLAVFMLLIAVASKKGLFKKTEQ